MSSKDISAMSPSSAHCGLANIKVTRHKRLLGQAFRLAFKNTSATSYGTTAFARLGLSASVLDLMVLRQLASAGFDNGGHPDVFRTRIQKATYSSALSLYAKAKLMQKCASEKRPGFLQGHFPAILKTLKILSAAAASYSEG